MFIQSDISMVLIAMGLATMVFLVTAWARGLWAMVSGRPSGLTDGMRQAANLLTMVLVVVVAAVAVY